MENIIKLSKNLQLLYVEDNADAMKSTMLMLNEFFDNIITAIDGEDGFNKFKNNNIDIIITDINMPKIDGLEMTKLIREIDKDVPILILSAHTDSDFILEGIKLGVSDYILKPLDLSGFIKTLSRVMHHKND